MRPSPDFFSCSLRSSMLQPGAEVRAVGSSGSQLQPAASSLAARCGRPCCGCGDGTARTHSPSSRAGGGMRGLALYAPGSTTALPAVQQRRRRQPHATSIGSPYLQPHLRPLPAVCICRHPPHATCLCSSQPAPAVHGQLVHLQAPRPSPPGPIIVALEHLQPPFSAPTLAPAVHGQLVQQAQHRLPHLRVGQRAVVHGLDPGLEHCRRGAEERGWHAVEVKLCMGPSEVARWLNPALSSMESTGAEDAGMQRRPGAEQSGSARA